MLYFLAEKKKDKKQKEDEGPVILRGVYMFPNGDKYDGEFIRLEDGSIERTGNGSHHSNEGQVIVISRNIYRHLYIG